MFDSSLRPWIDPPLNRAAQRIVRRGVTADQVTVAGFAVGLSAAIAIASGAFGWALVLVAVNRVADGLDGAVARIHGATDRGGFLDITLDFAFYASVPLAFAVFDPAHNSLPACALLAGFLINGSAFLAYAILAAKRGITSTAQGHKSITYLAGLAEGAETIAMFVLGCLWPSAFPVLATAFAGLCLVSAAARLVIGCRTFSVE
jgi:phosphatidylglycerophosphate synthase